MKRIFLGMSLIAIMTIPVLATTEGGKKKAKKKANAECKVGKKDSKKCDPKCIDLSSCTKGPKCDPTPACTGTK